MSDQSQGSGWWQAADGKWYPPEQHPDFAGGATQAVPTSEPPPTAAMPPVPPPAPPGPPPMMAAGPAAGPVGPPPGPGSSNARWIVIGVIAAVIVLIAAFLLLRSDDKKTNVAASSSSSSSASSSSSSSSASSSSTKSSSSSSSSSSEAPGQLSKAEIQQRLIKAKDLGSDFQDAGFTPDDTSPTPCGGQNISTQVPAKIDTGNDVQSGVAFFSEEVLVFGSESDANQAAQLATDSLNCPQPTVKGGGPLNVSGPNDVTSDIALTVDQASEFDIQTEESQGKLFLIRAGDVVVTFQFVAQTGTDTTKLPNELDTVNLALKRLAG